MTSDIKATATYLHDLATATRLDVLEIEAQDRIEANALAEQIPSCKECILRADAMLSLIGDDASEPPASGAFSGIADSCWFKSVANLVTLLNCAWLTYMADWDFANHSKSFPDFFPRVINAFLVFFSLELAVRLWRYGWYFFYGADHVENWMDVVIVVAGLIDFISNVMGSQPQLQKLRVIRLLRVLRVVRVLRMFRTLRGVIDSLSSTIFELVWSAVAIVAIQYMFALAIVMHIATVVRDTSQDMTEKELDDLTTVFGSIASATLSLFTVSMGGGDWAEHYKILSPTGVTSQVIYLLFVTFTFVALLNVILGVFVEKAIGNLLPTKEEKAKEHAEEEILMVNELKSLCTEGDKDGKGELSPQEWHDMFSEGRIVSYLDLRGFRSHDLRALFDVCSCQSENGNVEINAFVRACMRLKGPSSCFDVQTLCVEVKRLNDRVTELQEYFDDQFAGKEDRGER